MGVVYAGRLIAGLGIGQTTVIAPVYIAEIAPPSVRGLCTTLFSGAVYIGILIAYVANYGTSQDMPNSIGRWVRLCQPPEGAEGLTESRLYLRQST